MLHSKTSSLQLYWQELHKFLVSEASQRDSPKDQMLAAAERPGEGGAASPGLRHSRSRGYRCSLASLSSIHQPLPGCCPAPSHLNCSAVTAPCWWDSEEGLLEEQS